MNKKALFITIQIFILIVAIFLPKTLAENQLFGLEESDDLRIFEFNTTTEISLQKKSDFSIPVSLNSSHSVDVTISFKFELPQFFPKLLLGTKIGNWIMFRDKDHNMTIDIELELNQEKIPEWCHVEIENKTITIEDITTEAKSMNTKLSIKIDNDAPALKQEMIEIYAKFIPEAKWGFTPSEDNINFTILPEYVGLINAKFDLPENTTELILSTDKNTTLLPVNITNIGNGESLITIDIDGVQVGWNITLETDNITIPVGETKTININITPPQDKKEKTMNLSLTINSKSTSETEIEEKYLQGQTIELPTLKLIKEDTTEKIDFTIITLGLIVILVSILIIVLFFKKKK